MGRQLTRFEIDVDDHGVAVVTMARPPVNAVDLVMYREMRDLFADIDQIGPGSGRSSSQVRASTSVPATTSMTSPPWTATTCASACSSSGRPSSPSRSALCPLSAPSAGPPSEPGCAWPRRATSWWPVTMPSSGSPNSAWGSTAGRGTSAGWSASLWSGGCSSPDNGSRPPRCSRSAPLIAVVPSEELLVRARTEAARVAAYSPTAVRMGKQGLNDIEFLDVRQGLRAGAGPDRSDDGIPGLQSGTRGQP